MSVLVCSCCEHERRPVPLKGTGLLSFACELFMLPFGCWSAVTTLFALGNPSAIFGAIVSIHINAVNGEIALITMGQSPMPKGKKEVIQSHTEKTGQSINGFINDAIDEKLERETQKAGE